MKFGDKGWRFVEIPRNCAKGFFIYVLAAYFHISKSELAEHFNISKKTVESYIRFWRRSHRYIQLHQKRNIGKLLRLERLNSRKPKKMRYDKALLYIAETKGYLSIDDIHEIVGGIRREVYHTLEEYYKWGLLKKIRIGNEVKYALREESVLFRECPRCGTKRPLRIITDRHQNRLFHNYCCIACDCNISPAILVSFSKHNSHGCYTIVNISKEIWKTGAADWQGYSFSIENDFMLIREGAIPFWEWDRNENRGSRFLIRGLIPQLIRRKCPAYYDEGGKAIVVDLASKMVSRKVRPLIEV